MQCPEEARLSDPDDGPGEGVYFGDVGPLRLSGLLMGYEVSIKSGPTAMTRAVR